MRSLFRGFLGYNLLLMALGAVILFAIVMASFLFGSRMQGHAGEALRASRVDRLALEIVSDLVDAETAQRGFILTRDETYLEPYETALDQFEKDAAGLAERIHEIGSGRVVTDDAVAHLTELGREKLDLIRRDLADVRAGRLDAAAAVTSAARGKAVMDQVRAEGAAIRLASSDFRTAQAAEMRDAAGALTLLISLGAAMIVVLVIGAGLFAARHMRELAEARRDLEEINLDLEARVRERTHDIVRANEEVQRYAYIVSHDLRAPLVNIMGFTSELDGASRTIRDHLERIGIDRADPANAAVIAAVDEDVPEALGFIRSSMNRMDGLINEILKLSRAGRRALEPEPIDARALVAECLASIRHRFDEVGATVTIDEALPALVSDRAALQQIFTNLLDNAGKYLVAGRPGRIVVRGRRAGVSVVYDVEDNGRGVAPSDQERIFELFRRAGVQDRPGEGIGLAHTRALARRLGGDVTVDSDGVSGTVFHVVVARDLAVRMRSDRS